MISIFDKLLGKFEDFLTAFSGLAIFVLMITATVQIVSRKLLNMPIPGYIDFAEQSIAIFAFVVNIFLSESFKTSSDFKNFLLSLHLTLS